MSASVEDVFSAALSLPPDVREELADKLLESLAEADRQEIDEAWAAEVESRLEAHERGELREISGEEVFRSIQRGAEA
jgi:putative addiction module component (TIGR02574 family)